MYDIAICSMFRDSQMWHGVQISQFDRFIRQMMEQEKDNEGKTFGYYLVEGNSKDDTWDRLKGLSEANEDVHVFKHDIAGSDVASIVSEARFKNLSEVANVALRAARDSGAKKVLWVESDFILPTDIIRNLHHTEQTSSVYWDVTLGVAPVPVFLQSGKLSFYDTWAFEGQNGQKWANGELPDLCAVNEKFRPMKSVGSCMLMNGDNLRRHNLDFGDGCFPALCAAGKKAGLLIDCDITLNVFHPCSKNINGRLI